MLGRTKSVSSYRQVKEDNGLKVSIGFSNKILMDDLAESSFSRVIRAEARLQWVEQRMGNKEAEKQIHMSLQREING